SPPKWLCCFFFNRLQIFLFKQSKHAYWSVQFDIDRSEMIKGKQGNPYEASLSRDAVRKRPSLVADVLPFGQSQCPHLHWCSSFVQSCRRLDRPADLRGLRRSEQIYF